MNVNQLLERVTNDLIAAIEAGAPTWEMPWRTIAATAAPVSVDGRRYRGFNAAWLPLAAAGQGWESGVWATYQAWQRQGCQVRRGERSTPVILWLPATTNDTKAGNVEDDTDHHRPNHRRLVARTYKVFAAEQTDGADQVPIVAGQAEPVTDGPERLQVVEDYFAAVGADVRVGGNRACYVPALDRIHVPDLARFDQAEHYYSTLAHEHVHWTGHPSRLERDLSGRFRDDAYAAEELIAELGAALWSARTGLGAATRDDHASYLAGWLRILRADPRHLITVTARAQAALEHLDHAACYNPDEPDQQSHPLPTAA